MYEHEENDKTLQLRLPTRMREDLRKLADTHGLNVSQLVRNYLEKLLENQVDKSKNPSLDKESVGNKMFTVRLPETLHNSYKESCARQGILASLYPRQIITDLVCLDQRILPASPVSIDVSLRYLECFLLNELTKGGLRYLETTKSMNFDSSVPLIQQRDRYTFVVTHEREQFTIKFGY